MILLLNDSGSDKPTASLQNVVHIARERHNDLSQYIGNDGCTGSRMPKSCSRLRLAAQSSSKGQLLTVNLRRAIRSIAFPRCWETATGSRSSASTCRRSELGRSKSPGCPSQSRHRLRHRLRERPSQAYANKASSSDECLYRTPCLGRAR